VMARGDLEATECLFGSVFHGHWIASSCHARNQRFIPSNDEGSI
jgi:hypothetical protein